MVNFDYILYVYIAFGLSVVLLAVWLILLEIRLKKLFKGKKAKDLEGLMAEITEGLSNLQLTQDETKKYLETVEKRLKQSVQNVGVLRFNPFENSGSNQSFSISLLNEHGDGVVISSLYSREKVSIYAKPIKDYKSEYSLSDEEQKAINKSRLPRNPKEEQAKDNE